MNLAQQLDSMVLPEKVIKRINKKLNAVINYNNTLVGAPRQYGKNLFHKLCKQYKEHYLSGKEALGEQFVFNDYLPYYKFFINFFKEENPKLEKGQIISAFIEEAVDNGFGKSMIDDADTIAVLSSDRFLITINRSGVDRNSFGLLERYDLSIEFNEIKR